MKEDFGTSDGFSSKSLWLSWEKHRRSQSLAARLNVPLTEFHGSGSRWLKHPLLALRTLLLLLRKRPRLLFVQNPSAFLTLLAIALKPLFRFRLIVDAHNAGVYPFEPAHEKFAFIFPLMHRYADLTIVTNKVLADIVEGNGGKAAILPDPLPEFKVTPKRDKNKDTFIVTFICSYASDEPYIEVFKAAARLPDDVWIYVTGNNSKLSTEERGLAVDNNVRLTGFLSDDAYMEQLRNSDCIMALTSFLDCMVCGAYEAVALEIPLVLSDTPVLQDWFGKAAFFTANNREAIENSILQCRNRSLQSDCKEARREGAHKIQQRWEAVFDGVRRVLSSLDTNC